MFESLLLAAVLGVSWQHPAGMVTDETIGEMQDKMTHHEWARDVYAAKRSYVQPWLDVSYEELAEVFPKKRGNVYHNFSDPVDRSRLIFEPFNPYEFKSVSGKTYAPDTDAGIYKPDDKYHGTMYDGWACLFYQRACDVAAALGLIGRMENDAAVLARSRDILVLFADTLQNLPTDLADQGQYARILTYHREGDNKILFDLAVAYELVRDTLTPEDDARIRRHVLERLLNDEMLEPIYTYDHNNVYQWHRTIIQAALALEREDLVDWAFGYGNYSPENSPDHRSLRRIVATHFKPDGAYWELCSGYHLYPLHHFCELAVLSRNLCRMDPQRFPSEQYDYSRPDSEGGRVLKAALEWFMSVAMPDRTVTVLGDSTIARAGMTDYFTTAEVGYHFLNVRSIGDYQALREGQRHWEGLLYGAPEIVQHYVPGQSANLGSGWISLRGQEGENRVWAGLNAFEKGGGHQHADRLTLTTYQHGKLLALEKAVAYNESTVRELGTLSPAHNTVTVDFTSQKQGEALTPEEEPVIEYSYDGPSAKYAQVHADNLYPGVDRYRRSVALVEDIILDYFEVNGGETHDWIVNHAGDAPTFSVDTAPAKFEPQAWLYNGTSNVRYAQTDVTWEARWQVDDVTSRLTMLGTPSTSVYALETYPIENAVIMPGHPPCQTLCVRRTNDVPYLAVWDAWKDEPNLVQVEPQGTGQVLKLVTRRREYHVAFGPLDAALDDGMRLESDGVFTLINDTGDFLCVDATRLRFSLPAGHLALESDMRVTLAGELTDDGPVLEISPAIQFDTYSGKSHFRDLPHVVIDIQGNLWPKAVPQRRYAGLTAAVAGLDSVP